MQEVYDFTVPGYGNYLAGGLVHHNTNEVAAELAIHLTGKYPDWWRGHRFDRPIKAWIGSISNESQKDGLQPALLGMDLGENLGNGYIPKDLIVGKPKVRQAGIADVCDVVSVRYVSGGLSIGQFKTYKQGWRIWQSGKPDLIAIDEQPDENNQEERGIFSEIQARLFRSRGIFMAALTPLLGMTPLIEFFMEANAEGIWYGGATWDDAPHLMEFEKERLRSTYQAHELDVRSKGVPMMGEGAVFAISEESLKCDPVKIPDHWARIKGIDFGIDHPAAAADIAWDRDGDTIYVTRVWRRSGATIADHAAWLNDVDPWVPVSWPHDGGNRESDGRKLQEKYRAHPYRVRMLSKSARYPKAPGDDKERGGAQPVEIIVKEFYERMLNGKFKVFSTCTEWFDEFRSYHRKDGKIVARRDDVIKASMYAVMMKRYAMTRPSTEFTPRRQASRPIASAHL